MSHPAIVRRPDDTVAEVDPLIGGVIAGRFTVLSRLGAGAMGTVYRAKQAPIGREVAVKILRSDRALDESSRARFLREARANSLLTSPHTVTVFDFGAGETGEFYLAMELLEGESLGQRLKRVGRLDVQAALEIARQALRSLAEAHAKGIIHRDLKPDNLFFARVRTNETYDEIVKVLDFGVAKMLRADEELAMNAIETQAGTVFGTPRYMSPEQAQGKPLDARSDLYSLGVILYQMLTGRAPFTDDDAIVVMARHIRTMPRPMSEVAPDAHIPVDVENAIMRVLSKEPSRRPDSADAMAAELARARESALSATSGVRASVAPPAEPRIATVVPVTTRADDTFGTLEGMPSRPRRGWWVVGGVVVAVGAALVFALLAARGARPSSIYTPAYVATETTTSSPAVLPPPRSSAIPNVGEPATAFAGTAEAKAPLPATDAKALSPGPNVKPGVGGADPRPPRRRPATTKPVVVPSPAPAATPPVAATSTSGSVGYGYLE